MICNICHGLVEETAFAQVSCSCDVQRRCALGFVQDVIPRARANGACTITHQVTFPHPTLHALHQEVDLQPLFQQIRGFGRPADTVEDRAIGANITAAELRFNRRFTTPIGPIRLSRSAAERGEEDIWGDWRGTAPRQPQVEAPCGAYGKPAIDRHRFAFAGWLAHTGCTVENVQGVSGREYDRFGVVIRERDGPPRRRTFRLIDILPRIHQRYDGATKWGVHRRGQLARS